MEELEKARLFIDLVILKIKKHDPEIEKQLGLDTNAEQAPAEHDLRRHERHAVKYPCRCWLMGAPDDVVIPALMIDLSPGGCQLRLDRPLRIGEMLRVEIKTKSHGAKHVVGRIVWVRVDPSGDLSSWLVGVQFIFDKSAAVPPS